MPEEKARRFSVERFYVDLKWSKIDKGVFRNIRKDIRGILDILREAGEIGHKILVEGNFSRGIIEYKVKSRHRLLMKYFTFNRLF